MVLDVPVATLEEITFEYEQGKPILEGLTAEFRAGTMTAITGRSGVGKSTLLYILGLLVRPSLGRVRFADADVANAPDRVRSHLRSSHIGFVFQDAVLDTSRSVVDNVVEGAAYGRGTRGRWVATATALLGSFIPDVEATRSAAHLSGGQAQRVAFCRALVNNPTVILADEPTGNLDPETAVHLIGRFRQEAINGRTVVVATHDPWVVDQCDEVIEL